MAAARPDPFDESALLADARRKAGLEDFGDEAFRTPLRVLLASLAEAPLNAVGTTVLRTSIRRSLVQRLRAEDWRRRHPEIAEERIEQPLVIVGMMRSGTTLVQRLLARDPRFLTALGWEIAEPAPRPGTDFRAPDPRIADGIATSEQMRKFAPELHAIHPTDAMEPDEEIVFLADAFLSHVPEASCDVPVYRAWIDEQDFIPAYRYLHRMLQLLQWQKRMRGEHRERWLLKTPAHLGYLDTLFEVFPDARVIHVHRSPLETIPSGASLNWTLWKMYADDVDPAEVGRQWLERMAWATRRALAVRDTLPDASERFVDVGFRSLMADPLREIERLYEDLGLDLTPEVRAGMQTWLDQDGAEARPTHRYTADRFGLTEDRIHAAFADYIERFIGTEETGTPRDS
jgi:hypothetical protein